MQAELRDALEFLFPDSKVSKTPCRSMLLDVARGGTAAVHVLLNNLKKGDALRFSLRANGRRVKAARWFRLIDVPVEQNTGLTGFTEVTNKRNRFVIRRAPFRVYDAMEPVGSSIKATSPIMALRLHLPITPDTRPGRKEYSIEVQSGGGHQELSLVVQTHKAVIPQVGRDSWKYTNWFDYRQIATRHRLKPWSAEHWGMLRRYAHLMVRARQNTFWIPLRVIFGEVRGRWILDRRRLKRIVRLFTDAGMRYIEGGHLARRTGGVWTAKTFDVMGKHTSSSQEGHAALASITTQLMQAIQGYGWEDRWVQHSADEPKGQNIPEYRILVGMAHKYMPGIPVLDATEDTLPVGTVNIWCPKDHVYQQKREFFDAQRRFGDHVWFYTCCYPGGRWLNRLLDMELIRPTLLGWAAALFSLEGYLHWALNHYRKDQNPFEQTVGGQGKAFLPPGDTHIVYPGKAGPWSGLRLEAQREGIEDLELLQQLQDRDRRTASAIIRRAVRGFDDYTTDLRRFRSARRTLLEKSST